MLNDLLDIVKLLSLSDTLSSQRRWNKSAFYYSLTLLQANLLHAEEFDEHFHVAKLEDLLNRDVIRDLILEGARNVRDFLQIDYILVFVGRVVDRNCFEDELGDQGVNLGLNEKHGIAHHPHKILHESCKVDKALHRVLHLDNTRLLLSFLILVDLLHLEEWTVSLSEKWHDLVVIYGADRYGN